MGRPGIFDKAGPSPDGSIRSSRASNGRSLRLRPSESFSKDVEIWTRAGEAARKIADLPLADDIPINGVRQGPRAFEWQPTTPSTIVWAEAQDEGDLRKQVPHRDRIVSLEALSGEPSELTKTEFRFRRSGDRHRVVAVSRVQIAGAAAGRGSSIRPALNRASLGCQFRGSA